MEGVCVCVFFLDRNLCSIYRLNELGMHLFCQMGMGRFTAEINFETLENGLNLFLMDNVVGKGNRVQDGELHL